MTVSNNDVENTDRNMYSLFVSPPIIVTLTTFVYWDKILASNISFTFTTFYPNTFILYRCEFMYLFNYLFILTTYIHPHIYSWMDEFGENVVDVS